MSYTDDGRRAASASIERAELPPACAIFAVKKQAQYVLPSVHVGALPPRVSSPGTHVLLIEANPDTRAAHGATLEAGGYAVTAAEVLPALNEVVLPAILISDLASFRLLQGSEIRRLPPVVVLAADAHSGASACLRGANAWVPTHGDAAYFLATIQDLVRPRRPEARGTH